MRSDTRQREIHTNQKTDFKWQTAFQLNGLNLFETKATTKQN